MVISALFTIQNDKQGLLAFTIATGLGLKHPPLYLSVNIYVSYKQLTKNNQKLLFH